MESDLKENKLLYIDDGTDLSSRNLGKRYRQQIEEYISSGYSVTVDLTRVEAVSHSFADELFAVLYSKVGEKVFSEKLKIVAKDKKIISSISECIRLRLKSKDETL